MGIRKESRRRVSGNFGSILAISRPASPLSSSNRSLAYLLLLALLWVSCACKAPVSARPIGPPVDIHVPLGLPPVPFPADNPPTEASIALGRRLFYDNHFSKDNSLSCASCHDPKRSFADTRDLSLGVAGARGLRNAPTILNVAYTPDLFWDGRAPSLETQVGVPMANALEMNQTHEASIAKLKSNPAYGPLFRDAFGTNDITMQRVENAMASFERTILSGNSAFDQYEYQGRKDALSSAQVRGLAVFTDPLKGNCSACHTIGPKYALFTDNQFHNTGEGIGDNEEFTDVGRFAISKVDIDRGAFKTPTLRNVALTGPYMHDGKLKTLKDVVDFYAGKGNSNSNLDQRMTRIELSGRDRTDLVEFMKSLTGDISPNVGPPGKE